MVWVYISMIGLGGGFVIQTDHCQVVWAMPVEAGETPVDCVCMCHGELPVSSSSMEFMVSLWVQLVLVLQV